MKIIVVILCLFFKYPFLTYAYYGRNECLVIIIIIIIKVARCVSHFVHPCFYFYIEFHTIWFKIQLLLSLFLSFLCIFTHSLSFWCARHRHFLQKARKMKVACQFQFVGNFYSIWYHFLIILVFFFFFWLCNFYFLTCKHMVQLLPLAFSLHRVEIHPHLWC